MTRRTALYSSHVAAGARMTPFAGWDMPLHYGSQLEEHHAVRRACGVFDVSHMLSVDVHGPTAQSFLRATLANDVGRLSDVGMVLYTCMLTESGGIVDDLIVTRIAAECFRIVCNAGCADKDFAWLTAAAMRMAQGPAIEQRRDLALLAVQGPRAADILLAALGEQAAPLHGLAPFRALAIGQWLVGRTGYTGEDGFEIALPADAAADLWRGLLAAGAHPAGLGARDTLRLEAGLPLYGQDMDEDITPDECGLTRTVARGTEREFVGCAALAQRTARFQRIGLIALEPGIMRAHLRVESAHGQGETTSGGFAPTLQCSVAFARMPPGVALGEEVTVRVRDRQLRAMTVRPRFVRHGKSMLEENPNR